MRKEREREDLVLQQYILSASESLADKLLSPVSMSSLAADHGTVMVSCWSAIARPWTQL